MTHDYEKRVAQLESYKPLAECYPRLNINSPKPISIRDFRTTYRSLKPDETCQDDRVTIRGMQHAVSTMRAKS